MEQGIRKKILVVDDEIASRKTLEVFAKKLGYDVFSANRLRGRSCRTCLPDAISARASPI